MTEKKTYVGEVVDLYCGIGAISHGFKRAGFDIRAGYDLDASCRFGYETNNSARFVEADLVNVSAKEIQSRFSGTLPTVLVGCAPCQPFSTYRKGKVDDRWSLLIRFAELAVEIKADFITMENVAGLLHYREGSVFHDFLEKLLNDYQCTHEVVNSADFGVPQSRKRLVVIGSRTTELRLRKDENLPALTVAAATRGLPPLSAGGVDAQDPLHRSSRLSETNLRRIRYSKPGGSWTDWPEQLVTPCHRDAKGRGYRSVYGRMEWEKPAPTITTQFFGFGNGRFGHPEQDRAISLREAALLQSFPPDYLFFPGDEFPGFKTVGRWIGNAVPVVLAENIANRIYEEIFNYA